MDTGSLASQTFNEVTEYDISSSTYQVTTAVKVVVVGTMYRFVCTATNFHGESTYIVDVRAAFRRIPVQPAQILRSSLLSMRTQLAIEWSVEPDTEVPIIG